MNLANRLTLLRILLVPAFVACLVPHEMTSHRLTIMLSRYLAVVIFTIAALTDIYDGKIARKRGLVSNFGRLMDPLADKLLVIGAFIAFVDLAFFPAWFVIVILLREFLITGLRTLGSVQGRVIPADTWAKQKTIWQMVTIFLALVFLAMRDTLVYLGEWERSWRGRDFDWWFQNVVLNCLIGICLLLTVGSGVLYLIRNRDLLRE
ncbi:CDP-diacylglycerol--glycerol-3-phosphate 3-phosphatidyltransferase [Candidatus Sumerlaeota bacterium]|nr:CDP-diacylglycerol--glycerol-3-phosphate 3-phosphatidyltransferase [Candidatus Sumerlaeota bacterium]